MCILLNIKILGVLLKCGVDGGGWGDLIVLGIGVGWILRKLII